MNRTVYINCNGEKQYQQIFLFHSSQMQKKMIFLIA